MWLSWEEVLADCIGFLVIVVLVAGMIVAVNLTSFYSSRIRIEQLRSDAAAVHSSMAEDIAGQVAEMNKDIREKQAWRQTWLGLFMHPGWDAIKTIPMPQVSEAR